MSPQIVQIIDTKPTHVLIKDIATGQISKLNKEIFQSGVDAGTYSIYNQNVTPSVI